MRIISFVATEVYGYLPFDIKFNPDLTFLVGGNGSGKTTVLRLIRAIFSASIKELNLIPFKRVDLKYEASKGEVHISAETGSDYIEMYVSGIALELRLPKIPPEEIESRMFDMGEERAESYFSEMTSKYSDNPVYKFLNEGDSPFVLGLDRRGAVATPHPRSIRERHMMHRDMIAGRSQLKGSMAISLTEIQLMVQEAFRAIRRLHDRQAMEIREQFLVSAFEYTPAVSVFGASPSELPSWRDQQSVLERRREIESIIDKIVDSPEKVKKSIGEFFDKIGALFAEMSKSKVDERSVNLEWLINKAQIDRILKVVKRIDENKARFDNIFKPIGIFMQTINKFYVDSGKEIVIDEVGLLRVSRADKCKVYIDALSSGESQILIIFAHLMFNHAMKRSGIYIIDEPEVSLHLKWQEMFVDEIVKVSGSSQIIMATHSPEIIEDRETKCIEVRGFK